MLMLQTPPQFLIAFILGLFVNLPLFATHFTRRTLHIEYRILCLLIDHAVVLPNGNAKAH